MTLAGFTHWRIAPPAVELRNCCAADKRRSQKRREYRQDIKKRVAELALSRDERARRAFSRLRA
jgi:hypothetical protein